MQDKITSFYDRFGQRLRFIRQSRGLTLSELSAGSASTAQSWESGTYPRTRRWKELADRLNVSEPFLFKGIPALSCDYDFIRQNRSVIGDPPPSWAADDQRGGLISDSAGPWPSLADTSTVTAFLKPWFDAMAINPNVAPYVLGELKKHLAHEDLRLFDTVGTARSISPVYQQTSGGGNII